MGSREPGADETREEVKVLVTGFGPFGNNRINPSHLIASTLPSSFTADHLPTIRIVKASPIPVRYGTVRDVVPRLLFPQAPAPARDQSHTPTPLTSPLEDRLSTESEGALEWDFVLHIGMAAPRKYYTMETCAHRDGYIARDEVGDTLDGDTFWRDEYKAPEVLKPAFDVDDVWRRWKSDLMGVDIRPSNDAGHFLCDFIYYTSLVEYWRRDPEKKKEARVMFLHVPGNIEDLDIEMGRKVAFGLIGAMVGSASAEHERKNLGR
ncbi:MAG: hypothetical protein Q9220_000659 [cf. Caloplaca sp. 1 TL-2023]